jgi:hypothetical protein
MTSEIFNRWLFKFNLAMHGRKVLLIIDNASSHKILRSYSNVTLHFLPPNMTSKIQPLDAGIIRCFKARYKRQYVQWLVDNIEAGSVQKNISLIDSIVFAVKSWLSIEETIISNCWLHSGIVPAPEAAVLKAESDYKKVVDLDLRNLSENFKSLSVSVTVDEYLDADNLDQEELHSAAEITEDEEDASEDEEEDTEEVILGSEAMRCFLKLNSYLLQNYEETQKEQKLLNQIAAKLRSLVIKSKKQKSINDYFE